MARRSVLVAKKTTKPRVSRSEAYMVNKKYMGDEPEFKGAITHSQLLASFNWYSYMCENSEARGYINTYLKHNKRNEDIILFNKVPDVWLNRTSAWIARMIMRGVIVPEYDMEKSFNDRFNEMIKHAAIDKEENKKVVSIQDRMKEKQSEFLGEVESLIDDREKNPNFSFFDWLKKKEIPTVYVSGIPGRYVPWLQELIDALTGTDDQLKEAYSRISKKKLEQDIKFFNMMIEDAEKYCNVTKKTRAPRKPRTVSIEKKLKYLKYQKEDATFKIASINPEKIIGAQELWAFNTKYKIVSVFRAIDRGGLQVKGTSIINYDEKSSMSKSCGRKPEEVLSKIQNGGKIILRKLMDELKSNKPLQQRMNENTILMRVS